jgi:hypothetical protein
MSRRKRKRLTEAEVEVEAPGPVASAVEAAPQPRQAEPTRGATIPSARSFRRPARCGSSPRKQAEFEAFASAERELELARYAAPTS